MAAEINAIFEVDIKKANRDELDFINKAKEAFMSDGVIEYKGKHWIVQTIEYNIGVDGNHCMIFMVLTGVHHG